MWPCTCPCFPDLLRQLATKQQELSAQITAHMEAKAAAEATITGLRDQVDTLQISAQALTSRLEASDTARSRLDAEAKRLAAQVEALTMQLTELEESSSDSDGGRGATDAVVGSDVAGASNEVVQQQREQLAHQAAVIVELRATIAALRGHLQHAEPLSDAPTRSSAADDSDTALHSDAALQAQVAALQHELQAATEDADAARQQLADETAQNVKLQGRLAVLQSQATVSAAAASTDEEAAAAAARDHAGVVASVSHLRRAADRQATQLRAARQALAAARRSEAAARRQAVDSAAQASAAQRHVATCANAYTRREASAAKALAQLRGSMARRVDQVQQACERRVGECDARLASLVESLRRVLLAQGQQGSDQDTLRAELTKLIAANADLAGQVDATRAAAAEAAASGNKAHAEELAALRAKHAVELAEAHAKLEEVSKASAAHILDLEAQVEGVDAVKAMVATQVAQWQLNIDVLSRRVQTRTEYVACVLAEGR